MSNTGLAPVAKPLPSQELLNELLQYDSETGKLYWRPRDRRHFKSDRAAAIFAARYEGKEAFPGCNSHGYRSSRILGRDFTAHRVIWKLVTGEEPAELDHINGRREDNRIENLRPVSRTTNNRNQTRARNNTSGFTGVYWETANRKWVAHITVKNRKIMLGRYSSFDDACAARKEASERNGFHPNHGRAA